VIDRPTFEVLQSTFEVAREKFNKSADRKSLLCPRKTEADPKLLAWAAAHERAIAHRLAFYLECELRKAEILLEDGNVVVDCEYNRHLDARKTLQTTELGRTIVEGAGRTASPLKDQPGLFEFLVTPDIVVHERRLDECNFLVIEIKKASERNSKLHLYDDLKLSLFTSPMPKGYGYDLGVSLLVSDDVSPEERELLTSAFYRGGIKIQ
jgi:hypothetical protein